MPDYKIYRAEGAPAPKKKRGRDSQRPRGPQDRPRPASRAADRPRLWPKVLKLVCLTIVAVIAATAGLAYGWLQSTVATVATKDPVVVKATRKVLTPALPGKPVNILFMGADHASPGDPGRSDSLILMRLDPHTKSISMLSVPRDLWVEIPGAGMSKINAAYFYGGPALAVKTVSKVTGLPINHFVRADFSGFWDIVNLLGGVYLQVDHQYFAGTADNLNPGYQRLMGTDTLRFVRFRHDQYADFGRMQRQQVFMRELQRQAGRWSDWTHLPRLIKAVTRLVTSDISSPRQLLSLASLVLQLDTSHIYQTHIEGDTPTINGQSVVVASQQQLQSAISQFTDPVPPPATETIVTAKVKTVANNAFKVDVFNGSGRSGVSSSVASQLSAYGFVASSAGNAASFKYTTNVVVAPDYLAANAKKLAQLLSPARVQIVGRASAAGTVAVFVGSSFTGVSSPARQTASTVKIQANTRFNLSGWRAMLARTSLPVYVPTIWGSGFTYDSRTPFRAYTVKTDKGRKVAALVAVVRAPASVDPKQGAFDIQEIRWTKAPILANPTHKQFINGRTYLLYYSSDKLIMVAWTIGTYAYWVTNTLDNAVPNDFLLALATSFKRLK